jgi:hypothetical protein
MRATRWTSLGALAAILLTTLASPVFSQTTFFADPFEYADQAAFDAVWSPVTGKVNAFLVTEGPRFNPPDASPLVTPVSPSTTMAAFLQDGTTRSEKAIGETGNIAANNVVSYSFDFYDVDATVSPFRHHHNLQDSPAPGGANQLVSMGMNNNQALANSGGNYYMARILGYAPSNPVTQEIGAGNFYTQPGNPGGVDPDGGPDELAGLGAGQYFKLNDFGVGLRSEGWHNLRVDISLDDSGLGHNYEFFVDGQLAERVSNVHFTPQGAAPPISSVRSYDHLRIGSGLTSLTYLSYLDNLSVVINPEGAAPEDNADFDNDGDVDGADFLTWQRGVGIEDGSANLADGDANDDGNVTAADLEILKTQFGAASAAAAAAVPEPATYGLALLALAGAAALRRRR